MTANLCEAFHVAAVRYLGWRRSCEEQARWGWIDMATGQRAYPPEPEVEFFGRSFTLTQICTRAAVLAGALPLHIRVLFNVIDDGIGEPTPSTYAEAVEALSNAIAAERDIQIDAPLTQSPLVDQIRERSFREGVAAAVDLIRHEVGQQ